MSDDEMKARIVKRAAALAAIVKQAERFRPKTVADAFKRSKGQCECERRDCDEKHKGRCPKTFRFDERGRLEDPGAWQANHLKQDALEGPDEVDNCEVLCVPCHISTFKHMARPSSKP